MTYKIDNLCGGLQGGIDGAIHAAQVMCNSHQMEENWGVFLIDTMISFNEQDPTVML
jgi:hypothetical protein